jgi:uncharacterized membrane protein
MTPPRTTLVRRELPSWILLALAFAAAALTWGRAPARVPVHWDIHGHADRYGGRFEGLLLVPIIAVAVYLLLRFLPRADPGRANYARFAGAYDVIRVALLVFMLAVQAMTLAPLYGLRLNLAAAVPALVGVLFLVLGATMGKLRPNWFVGIRTPWTLSSKTAWVRTHRVGGWLFAASGAATLAASFVAPAWTWLVMLAGGLVATVGSVVYSYVVWRGAGDHVPPAGTSPAE